MFLRQEGEMYLVTDAKSPLTLKGRPGSKEDKLDVFNAEIDKRVRKANTAYLPSPVAKIDGGHDGWLLGEVDASIPSIWSTEMTMMLPVTKELLDAQTEEVKEATERYKNAVVSFRSAAKNDVSSAKATAGAIEESVIRMKRAYDSAVSRLTAPDFVEAINNAERLAAALVAIERLTETKVSFAVFGSERKEKP